MEVQIQTPHLIAHECFMSDQGESLFAGAPFIHNFISMQRIYVFLLSCIFGLLPAVHVLPAHAQQSPRVVFSELAWGGSARGIADEWFELANQGDTAVDVSGWSITGLATNDGTLTLPQGATIPAYGTYLVANYDIGDSSTLAVTPDLVTTSVSIPNTKLTASLLTPDGTVVDSVTDPGTPDYGSASTPFTSMERDLATLSWQHAASSSGLVDTTQLGTPGNVSAPTISEEPVREEASLAQNEVEEPVVEEPVVEEPIVIEEPAIASSVEDLVEPDVVIETAPPVTSDETATEVMETVIEDAVDTAPTQETTEEAIEDEAVVADAPVSEASIVVEEPPIVEVLLEDETTVVVESNEAIAEPEYVVDVIVAAAPTIEEIPEPAEAVTPTVATTGNVILNELFVDGDEWIEVRNADTHDVDVSAWLVRDASGKATSLGAYVLAPDALLVIADPLGKLNNSGDEIELLNAAGTVVDRVEYGTSAIPAPAADESLMRTAKGWEITTHISQGTANPIIENTREATPVTAVTAAAVENTSPTYVPSADPAPHVVADTPAVAVSRAAAPAQTASAATVATKKSSTKKSVTKASSNAPRAARSPATPITITNLSGVADGTRVRFTGPIIALPHTFGSQLMFLDGAPVYFYHAQWPTLALGDIVTVIGDVSTARGERRIKVASADAIAVAENTVVTPTNMAELDTTLVNRLVRIDGAITSREGDTVTVAFGEHTIRVVARTESGIVWSSLGSTHVVLTGVLRHQDGELVLMPRTADDVVAQHDEAITAVAAPTSTGFPTRTVVGGGVLTSTAGVLGYWFIRSRTFIPNL